SGQIQLINLGDVPLTGLTASVIGGPANVIVQVTPPIGLDGMGTGTMAYSITAADASQLEGHLTLHITSAQRAVLDVPVNLTIVPLTPQLIANPGFVNSGMLRGSQTLVSVELSNIGGAPTESLQIQLPDVPWMSSVSPATIEPLSPGAKDTITLAL